MVRLRVKTPRPVVAPPSLITPPRVSVPRPGPPRIAAGVPKLDPPPVPSRVADAAGDAPALRGVEPTVASPAVGAPQSIGQRATDFRRAHPRLAAAGITVGGVLVYAQATNQSFGDAASDLSSRTVGEAAELVGGVAGGPIGEAAADAAAAAAKALGVDFEKMWYYLKVVGAGVGIFGGLWAVSTARTALRI